MKRNVRKFRLVLTWVTLLALLLGIFGTVPALAATIYVDDDNCPGPGSGTAADPYCKIQDAVNAASAGDTINVAAGAYDEQVDINKPVTLLGANAGVHPAVGTHPTETVGTRGPETILKRAWYAFLLTADDITIDGFKFTGETGGSPATAGQAIRSYADANSFHLTNCIFDVSRRAVTSGWVLFGDGSHDDVLIDFNLFEDDQGDATLYFGGGSPSYDRLRVAYNTFNAWGDGIYWATSTPMVDGIVEGNEFDGTIGGIPGQGGTGMNIGQGGNIIIRDNWFHDMWYTGFQVGIVGGSVTDNTFEDMYPIDYYGTWYPSHAFELWGGQWGTAVSTNVTISGNTVKFNNQSNANADEHGVRLRSGADAANIHVNYNEFYDGNASTTAAAARNQGSGTLDAEMNYWGCPATSDPATDCGTVFLGAVDYCPWVNTAGGTTPVYGTVCAPPVIEVGIDIKPQSCPNPLNVKSKGVLPVAVLGTEDFDVAEVDPASVRLEGVPPLRWAWEDVATPFEPYVGKENCYLDCTEEGPDGYLDLTLKFSSQEIVGALGEVSDRDCLVLTLTGNLKEEFGGTAIVGEDVVVILKKGKK